jgi:hypothetical protein
MLQLTKPYKSSEISSTMMTLVKAIMELLEVLPEDNIFRWTTSSSNRKMA